MAMPVKIVPFSERYPYEISTTTPGTPNGSTSAFAITVDMISVWCSDDAWIHPTSTGCTTAGNGSEGGRIFLPAGMLLTIPWGSKGFFVVNANTGVNVSARVTGWKVS